MLYLHNGAFRLALLSSLFISCHHQHEAITGSIVIRAHVKNLPEGKIYLANANDYHHFLDSTICRNDTFSFTRRLKPGFIPYLASLEFIDKSGNIEPLMFSSGDIMAPNNKPFTISGFMMEPGITEISGVYNGFSPPPNLKVSPLNIVAGRQNDVLFRMNFSNFAVSGGDHSALMERNVSAIKKYTFSYYLLEQIYQNRDSYTNEELKTMMSLFDNEVAASGAMAKLKKYVELRVAPGNVFKNVSLQAQDGTSDSLFSSPARTSLVIFWASWCGPCRMEIPNLKTLYNKFGTNGKLNMISISIDADTTKWRQALIHEKMPWKQLWANSNHVEATKAAFGVGSIPAMILIDADRKEVTRFVGYSAGDDSKWINVITRSLGEKQ